ncbi:hypothetical protein [Robiginitalea sp. IMCC43444]|uniref:hypothetical protein n=1 Tax=Robiginitalea sp. IMCC43444 TaxID=3459121 RepID=UPI00404106A1
MNSYFQPWYTSFLKRNAEDIDPGFIKYLMDDYHFKNRAFNFHLRMREMMAALTGLQQQLVDLFIEINVVLTQPTEYPDAIANFYLKLSPSDTEKLVGSYLNNLGDTLELTIQNGQLMLNNNTAYTLKGNVLIAGSGQPVYRNRYVFDLKENTICSKLLYEKDCYTKYNP